MTQKQSILFGDTIDDINLNRLAAIPAGVYEGMVPALIGTGGLSGWTLRLSTSERGISVWKTTGDATHGRIAIEETSNIELAIDKANTLPRIDLVVGYHRWIEGPMDAGTGRPTGEFTTAQHAKYAVVKGTPSASPEPPPIPLPYNEDGDTACILAVVRIADATMNSAYCERWDPTDWTADRRGIPHVIHFTAINPLPGNPSTLSYYTANATSDLWQFDWEDEAIIVPRSGWVHVHIRANVPTEGFGITRKPFGGIVFDPEATAVGHFVQTIYFHGGDRIKITGDNTDTISGQMTYLGFSEKDVELQDLAHTFTITNVDQDVYGADTFPKQITIPITFEGAVEPIEWSLLSGTDLPGATLSGNNITSTLTDYGAWTIRLIGRDSRGYVGRKSWHYWKFESALVITNASYNLFGSTAGRAWGDTSGADYGEAGKVGTLETFQITKSGGLGPFKYYARQGNNLLNPTCPEATGLCTLWTRSHAPTDANRALGLPEYCGETLVELKVQDWTGSIPAKTVYFYAPRIHAGYGMADRSWRRDTATAVTVQRRPSAGTINLNFETGQPTQTAYKSGSHAWEITSATLPSATLATNTGPATTLSAPFPVANGTYDVTLGAHVTVGAVSAWAREAISVTVAPYGTLGVGWALYDDPLPTGTWHWIVGFDAVSNSAGAIAIASTTEDPYGNSAELHPMKFNTSTNKWEEITIPNFLSDNSEVTGGIQTRLITNIEGTKIGIFRQHGVDSTQFLVFNGVSWAEHAGTTRNLGYMLNSLRWKGTTLLMAMPEGGMTGRNQLYKAEGEGSIIATGQYLPDPTGGFENMIWYSLNTSDKWLLYGSSNGYTGPVNGWIIVSTDEGATWSNPVIISDYLTEILAAFTIGSKFVLVGKNGTAIKSYASIDGINWNEIAIPIRDGYTDLMAPNTNSDGSVMLLVGKRVGFSMHHSYVISTDGGTSWVQGPEFQLYNPGGETTFLPLNNGMEWMFAIAVTTYAHSPARLWYYRTT